MKFKKGHTPWNKGKKIGFIPKECFKKGNIPWNKDKKHTKETKKKMSESLKKLWSDDEYAKKMSDSRKGYVMPEEQKRKVSESKKEDKHPLYGKHRTEKVKEKIRNSVYHKNLKNENHWNWKGGISKQPYDKTFNNRFKNLIRKRDNQICMLCGIHREKLSMALDIHHINYNKLITLPQNSISLCRGCHVKTNINRKHWIKFFQSLLSERYGYNYLNKEIIINII